MRAIGRCRLQELERDKATGSDTATVNSELASIQESFYPSLCENGVLVWFGVVRLTDGALGWNLLMTGS